MAYKMKGRSLQKGTTAHKKATIAHKKALKVSPLKQYADNEDSEGMDWLEEDLLSEGYKKRLLKELQLEGDKNIIKTPEEGDKYYTKVPNPTADELIKMRKDRLANTTLHAEGDTGEHDLEGDQAITSHVEDGKLKEGSDIYYNPNMFTKEEWLTRKPYLDVHEITHSVTAGEHGMLPSTKNLLVNAKKGDGKSGTINKAQEVYARYKTTQMYLQEQGIFDAFTGEEFTDEHVNAINELMKGVTANNYRSKGIPYEVFTFFGNDKQMKDGTGFNKKISEKDMKTIFNEVASLEDGNEIIDDGGNVHLGT